MKKYWFASVLIAIAVISRVLPHLPNMTPITALALFGGSYLGRRWSLIVPLLALLISDYFIGFYSGMLWVYGSFIAIGCIGIWLRDHRTIGMTVAATLAGSILFFIVTNFGVWISSEVFYPHTVSGLLTCYAAAIPFFRNTVIGDFLYVTILFGLFETGVKVIPALRSEISAV